MRDDGVADPRAGAAPVRLGAVVVPAHQEGERVGRCIDALAQGWVPGELDVVVVSNGSTDDTVAVARERAAAHGLDLRVLDLPEPGKVGAIRAGEAATTGPRLYLDADTRCSAAAARAMLRAVGPGTGPGPAPRADVAVPTRVLDLAGCSWPARLYHRAWAELPWVQEQLAGRGAYALSERARAGFGTFPAVTADDRFATTLVPRERARVVDAPVHVTPAPTLREVLVVRRRVFAGNAELAAAGVAPAHDRRATDRAALAVGLLRRPTRWPGLLLWAGVTVAAKLAARRGAGRWRARGPQAAPAPGPEQAAPASLSVVVVTFRSAATVEACLVSLQQAARRVDVPVRLVVVDNDSDDDSLAVVRRVAPEATVVARQVNDGFGRGCTVGAEAVASDAVLFCNPDVVVAPDALRALLAEAAHHPGAAMLGGKQLRADGSVDRRSWWHRPTWWSLVCFATGLSSVRPGRRWSDPENGGGWDGRGRDVGAVSGGFMLLRRSAWDQVGGFDDDMLLYGEDLDLCLRVHRAGHRIRVCGEAEFRHDVGASSRARGRDASAAPAPDAAAFRLQLVLRGRAAVLRRHFGPAAVLLLELGVRLRAAVAPVGSRTAGGRASTDRAAWAAAWRNRSTWRAGWQAGDDLGRVLAAARTQPGQSARARQ
ncbi:glycosyltransferase [Jannaschia sp. R86511]|uniref:glycosyltransferase family 2 protein n=1 Tax=Jannaschia sp. R86511 TaxID=3093853 RepID=UPI0036D29CB6